MGQPVELNTELSREGLSWSLIPSAALGALRCRKVSAQDTSPHFVCPAASHLLSQLLPLLLPYGCYDFVRVKMAESNFHFCLDD